MSRHDKGATADWSRWGRRLAAVAVLGALIVAPVAVAIIGAATGAGPALAAPPTPTRATIVGTQFTVGDGATGEAFAECPGRARALGGGVVQSGVADANLVVRASGPLDASGNVDQTDDGDIAKRWYAAVANSSGEQRIFRVFAICSAASTATIEATAFTVESGVVDEDFATCPGKRRALGGGVVPTGPVASFNVKANGPLDGSGDILQTEDGDKAKQWYAAIGNGSLEARIVKVLAICSRASKATLAVASFLVAQGTSGEFFAECPGNKRALGGGLVQSGSAFNRVVEASGPLDRSGDVLQTDDGDKATQWYAAVRNEASEETFKVLAICE